MIWTLKIIGIKIADEYYPLKKEDKMLKNIISAVFFTAIIATSMPTIAADNQAIEKVNIAVISDEVAALNAVSYTHLRF